jgi:hypothetical protein
MTVNGIRLIRMLEPIGLSPPKRLPATVWPSSATLAAVR